MTVAPDEIRRDGPQDRWIPWAIVAFMGVVVLVNGTMVWFATTSFTGLQTEGHYVKGLAYNRVLEAERAEQALGWTVTTEYSSTGVRRGLVAARVQDAAGAPLDGATVTARLVRPTQAGHDMDVALVSRGNGVYATEVELPLSGLWDIQTQIAHRSDIYRTAQRILAP